MEYIQNRDDLYSLEAGDLFRNHFGVNALTTPHVEQIINEKPASMMIEIDALGGTCLRIKPSDLASWLSRLPKHL